MQIRNAEIMIKPATAQDVDAIRLLFFDTVTTVNARDYNEEQIKMWSAGYANVNGWLEKLAAQNFFIAKVENMVLGFASLSNEGCVDYLYVHKDYQRKGIAGKLVEK